MFHETINYSFKYFSSQVFNLNSGSHLIEATPITNDSFSAGPIHLTVTQVTLPHHVMIRRAKFKHTDRRGIKVIHVGPYFV